MDASDLNQALKETESLEAWVASVRQFFESYELFYGHGTENPLDEAHWLVEAVNRYNPERPNISIASKRDAVFNIAVKRVGERRPLAYLLNEAWFAGLSFYVDERVLIPRSPLAELIERQFAPWTCLEPGHRVLEIGTGSGCIAVAIAHHCPGVLVDATDISNQALDVAAINAKGWEEQVKIIESDLFSAINGQYQIIVSNPPYVAHDRLVELPMEYQHEPSLALEGGTDGLNIVNRLLPLAAEYLTPDGLLFLEVGETQQVFDSSHIRLPATWLEFDRGGEGVAVLTREELTGYLAD
ncbi:MAG TPA: 50S ribosomal protein L3 N(5)-glutamine methyltransferase [Methylococcaceae bacterium]|jgi:ribosomal protein L3 glutamine methyltransferase|nr:50S ribosomal protein L3 N(5)-glutamine methyltransferase [Methylococcaceae bacterium]